MKLKRRSKIAAEFNMSSMTDIIFLLLIFFVITARITPEPILKVLLPKGAVTEVVNQVIKVYVDENLNYAIDDKKVSFDRLPMEMDAVLIQKPGATVSIYGHKTIPYEKVMDVVYLVNQLGGKPVLALQPVK
ncbi:MAG: biopolymer transporter ExbD [Flavobacteriales bacterium]|nr:biopolymer transporter ExbD [Bacteroidota bacterium]MCB9241751.1 biopolymer transporter ExbD [Flavobacteriales bacterium]